MRSILMGGLNSVNSLATVSDGFINCWGQRWILSTYYHC